MQLTLGLVRTEEEAQLIFLRKCIRPLKEADIPRWLALRAEFWPYESPAELARQGRAALVAKPPLVVFVAEENNRLVGFLELGLRSVAEGCTSSLVPYVEGWYVAADGRRRGVGGALMQAAEKWSRARGYTELSSATEAVNRLSRAWDALKGRSAVVPGTARTLSSSSWRDVFPFTTGPSALLHLSPSNRQAKSTLRVFEACKAA